MCVCVKKFERVRTMQADARSRVCLCARRTQAGDVLCGIFECIITSEEMACVVKSAPAME